MCALGLILPLTEGGVRTQAKRPPGRPAVPQVTLWSLTSLREKLIKIGSKVVSHGRYGTAKYRIGTLILKTSGVGTLAHNETVRR